MRRRLSLRPVKFMLLLLLSSPCVTLAQSNGQVNSLTKLVLTHVTVIDGGDAPPRRDMTVVIIGNRISEIDATSQIADPQNSQIIDATGKFLIPGLWDMHVHPDDEQDLGLFIANGVTGIRIMWGSAANFGWRKERETGKLLAPYMEIASPLIDGPKPFWSGSVSVSSDPEARAAVDTAKVRGADFVKVYTFLPREEFFAIAAEANKQGIPFAGHVPMSVSALEASNAGMKSIEHLTGVMQACSTRSEELNKAAERDLEEHLRTGDRLFEGAQVHALRSQMFETYSSEKASELFDVFKKNGTWQTPTLTLWRMFSSINDTEFTNDPRLKFVAVRSRQSWNPATVSKESVAENTALSKDEFRQDLKLVGAMKKAGVGILAGTDTGNPYCIPGFALHDELQLLVRAGLTPLQALQAATVNPARFLGKEDDFGVLKVGRIANLVLLEANPLDNIANTTKIGAVILDGQFLSRSALDGMLSNVEALANRKPIGDVLFDTIQQKGIHAAVEQYHQLAASQQNSYVFSENELVKLGYQLLHTKKVKDAIEIFKLSVDAYPQSYNTYDSLAEAYMDHGDRDLAIQNYRKSLDLNPANTNAVRMLEKLKAP